MQYINKYNHKQRTKLREEKNHTTTLSKLRAPSLGPAADQIVDKRVAKTAFLVPAENPTQKFAAQRCEMKALSG